MDLFLNRHSDMPIRHQIRGMIEYAISFGGLGVGDALPSVRDLADQLGVAPMTVSQVYQDLKRDGLVETRAGAGTFVADSHRAQLSTRADIARLQREIDGLIDSAATRGIAPAELALLFKARIEHRAIAGPRPAIAARIAIVGLFDDATRSYADAIERQAGPGIPVLAATIAALQDDAALRSRIAGCDPILSFLTLTEPLSAMFPDNRIVPIRFIPSEPTRLALAAIDPMARVAVISRFPAFLPILRFGVQRFAAHCRDVAAGTIGDPGLGALLSDRGVLVHATGAEAAIGLAPPGIPVIEYRHIPDPGDLDRILHPLADPTPPQRQEKAKG